MDATTITDEQVKDLWRWARDACQWRVNGIDIAEVCAIALDLPCPQPHPASGIAPTTREQARARLAEILNARAAATEGK